MNTQGVIKIVQITDCHLFGQARESLLGINTLASFDAVLELVRKHSPDAQQILVTGDISQHDSLNSYRFCQERLATLNIPGAWLYGNHDEPTRLSGTPFADNFPKHIQLDHWQILLLHTQVKNAIYGQLTDDELLWASHQLSAHPERPTLIVTHHHPLPVGSQWMDAIKLKNSPHLFELLASHTQAKLWIHGHTHQTFNALENDVTVLGTPSICVQFMPGSVDFSTDIQQPGYREILLYPNGDFTSRVFRLPPGTFLPDSTESGY